MTYELTTESLGNGRFRLSIQGMDVAEFFMSVQADATEVKRQVDTVIDLLLRRCEA